MLDPITNKLHTVKTLLEAGIIRPTRPDRLARLGITLIRWGPNAASATAAAAIRFPDDPAIIDELGTLTFSEVHRRTNALAHSLAEAGISEGDGVAIMCRNHRGFIDAMVACAKLGANALLLNTAFAGPQITDVCDREKPAAIIYDDEFTELVKGATKDRKSFIGWHDPDSGRRPRRRSRT